MATMGKAGKCADKPGTNGVSIAGMLGIPCVGFGPAAEEVAHTVNDSVPIEHLTRCAAMYAAFAGTYCAINNHGQVKREERQGAKMK